MFTQHFRALRFLTSFSLRTPKKFAPKLNVNGFKTLKEYESFLFKRNQVVKMNDQAYNIKKKNNNWVDKDLLSECHYFYRI